MMFKSVTARFCPPIPIYLFFLSLFFDAATGQSYFPETGPGAVYQRSLDLKSRLNVLMVSLQPGFEDLAILAYYRMGQGARIMSAYVTNGEGGKSDLGVEYPLQLAALRRNEATQALARLNGETYFLTMPDLPSARDSARVRMSWPSDTLQSRLMKLIAEFKPDIILLCGDREAEGPTVRWNAVRFDLLEAARKIAPIKSSSRLPSFVPFPSWEVGRVLAEDGSKSLSAPVQSHHPIYPKSYVEIAEEARAAYLSLHRQHDFWRLEAQPSYEVIHPHTRKALESPDHGLPLSVPGRLRSIDRQIQALAAKGMFEAASKKSGAEIGKRTYRAVLNLLDSLTYHLMQPLAYTAREQRILIHWKSALDNLRNTLLGVVVHYTLSDSVLTGYQLTFLTIDSVSGLGHRGMTEIFFPGVDKGWIINEAFQKRIPLKLHEPIRILSPQYVEFNTPGYLYGLNQNTIGTPFHFFILHRDSTDRAKDFNYRVALPMYFAPRFSVEVLTPIVMAIDSEQVVVRLTNHSRDGVLDQIGVRESLVVSSPRTFRLSFKGSTHEDTLFLQWKRQPLPGTHLYSINIAGEPVAQFAARQHEVLVDRSKRVGLMSEQRNSPTAESLRRLGLRWRLLAADDHGMSSLDAIDVLVIDHRALTFLDSLGKRKSELHTFVRNGGHLIILSQDAKTWNTSPLWEGLRFFPTQLFDEALPLQVDTSHILMSKPNVITENDWSNWLYQRASLWMDGDAAQRASIPVRANMNGEALLLSWEFGSGKVSVVGLALHFQLQNVHAGAARILANLISY